MNAAIHKPSGTMPSPSISVVACCAVQNALTMSSLNQKIAAPTAMNGIASSSYQVTFAIKLRNLDGEPRSLSGAVVVLFAIDF